MISRSNYYSALCHLRQILVIEDQLLARAKKPVASAIDTKVA